MYLANGLRGAEPPLQASPGGVGGGGLPAWPSRLEVRGQSPLCETESKRNHSRETWLETKHFQFPDSSAFSPELFAFAEARETNGTLKMEPPWLRK